MPDITPASPVAALWPPDQDGYNSGRARSRLEAVNITTVGRLCAMTGEEIRAIPRAGKGVVTEVRRALTANGLHLAGERAPSPAQVQAAIEAGRAEAHRKAVRDGIRREEPAPVTLEDFAALVKDLRGELADPQWRAVLLTVPRTEHPRAFAGRTWAWRTVGPQGVSAVTGYSAVSVRRYRATARAQHADGTADHRTMPPPDPKGRWVIGDLALWMATRNEAQAATIVVDDKTAAMILADIRAGLAANGKRLPYGGRKAIAREYGVSEELVGKLAAGMVPWQDRTGPSRARQEKPRIRADDDEVAAFLAARIARTDKHVAEAVLLAEARAAGLAAATHQLRRLLPDIRAAEARRRRRPTGKERARGESLRSDGLLYAGEVARDWALSPSALTHVRERGDIKVAGWDGKRPLYDPKRLRARTDRRRTPVDVSHPLARLEPGDENYEKGTAR